MSLSESSTAGKEESSDIVKPAKVRRTARAGDGLSDAALRNRARQLGWVKGSESVVTFMERFGWKREGIRNEARWFNTEA